VGRQKSKEKGGRIPQVNLLNYGRAAGNDRLDVSLSRKQKTQNGNRLHRVKRNPEKGGPEEFTDV